MDQIVKVISDHTDNNIYFNLEKGILKEEFKVNPLMPRSDSYEPSWHVKVVNKETHQTDIEACKLLTYYTYQDENESKRVTTFLGIFLKIKFPKEFQEDIYITTETWRRGAGGFLGFGSKADRIVLESPLFEKKFNVFGNDPVEARYILTLDFMEKLLEKLKDIRCYLTFHKGYLYVALDKFTIEEILPQVGDKESYLVATHNIIAYMKAVEYFAKALSIRENKFTKDLIL
ncbi:DUF3137 domain-containing protein [Heliorestis acidaminivorans]|uniref:DUF3137 domain-containing protein n=2 Tax=Heliorestis acidaminivorans TaxID=553427 RepID=A0A6I0EYL6_9FIRM|nr:DUF3137 domain-containing protein [Heliorestis acidaminivorans]